MNKYQNFNYAELQIRMDLYKFGDWMDGEACYQLLQEHINLMIELINFQF